MAKSRSRSRKRLPTPTKGALGKYTTTMTDKTRHGELRRLEKKLGKTTLIRDLNLRANLNKGTRAGQIMRRDMEYVRQI